MKSGVAPGPGVEPRGFGTWRQRSLIGLFGHTVSGLHRGGGHGLVSERSSSAPSVARASFLGCSHSPLSEGLKELCLAWLLDAPRVLSP